MFADPARALLEAITGGAGNSARLGRFPRQGQPGFPMLPENDGLEELPAYATGGYGGEQSLYELPVSSLAGNAAPDSGEFGDYQPPGFIPPAVNDGGWHNPLIRPAGNDMASRGADTPWQNPGPYPTFGMRPEAAPPRGRMGDGMPLVDSGPPTPPNNMYGGDQMRARQRAMANTLPQGAVISPGSGTQGAATSPGSGTFTYPIPHRLAGVTTIGTPQEIAQMEASRQGSVRDIAAMDQWQDESQAILKPQIAKAEALLEATRRGEILFSDKSRDQFPFLRPNQFGTDQRVALNQEGLRQQQDEYLTRIDNAIMERGGTGQDGRTIPMGQMPGQWATTQRVGLVGAPATKRAADEPKWVNPNAQRTVDPLETQMGRYGDARQKQRDALAARGKTPEEANYLMGGRRPGPDLSVVRAVHNQNMRSGMNPRLSQALALDAGGGAMQGGSVMALRDQIMGNQQERINPVSQAQADLLGVQRQVELQKLRDLQDPVSAINRGIQGQNAGEVAGARGLINNPTVDATGKPEVQSLTGNDYLSGGSLHPEIDSALTREWATDSYDSDNSHIGNLWGVFGRGGWSPEHDEQIYVDRIKKRYPSLPDQAIRRKYRELSQEHWRRRGPDLPLPLIPPRNQGQQQTAVNPRMPVNGSAAPVF